jgi:hypothetical protein
VRLAEVVGALSLAVDLSNGLPAEKGLRTALVASRLAKVVGASSDELGHVFWASALRFVGCVGYAHESGAFAAADDNSMRQTLVYADFDRPLDAMKRVVQGFAPEAPVVERALGITRFILSPNTPRQHAQATCESAVFFARSLRMSDAVVRALDATYERFDGKGPRGLPGEQLPFAARVVDVADVLELFAWTGGLDLARSVLLQRRAGALDPSLVDAALDELPRMLDGSAKALFGTNILRSNQLRCARRPTRSSRGSSRSVVSAT